MTATFFLVVALTLYGKAIGLPSAATLLLAWVCGVGFYISNMEKDNGTD